MVIHREDDAVVEVLDSFPVQDADPLQGLQDLFVPGKDLEQRAVDEAGPEVGCGAVVGDAPVMLEVVQAALVLGEGVLVVGDHAGQEFLFLDGEAVAGVAIGSDVIFLWHVASRWFDA
jgi:hypothetical protein